MRPSWQKGPVTSREKSRRLYNPVRRVDDSGSASRLQKVSATQSGDVAQLSNQIREGFLRETVRFEFVSKHNPGMLFASSAYKFALLDQAAIPSARLFLVAVAGIIIMQLRRSAGWCVSLDATSACKGVSP